MQTVMYNEAGKLRSEHVPMRIFELGHTQLQIIQILHCILNHLHLFGYGVIEQK